jgi:hypothetical protein
MVLSSDLANPVSELSNVNFGPEREAKIFALCTSTGSLLKYICVNDVGTLSELEGNSLDKLEK